MHLTFVYYGLVCGCQGWLADITLHLKLFYSIEQYLNISVVYMVSWEAAYEESIGQPDVKLFNCVLFLLFGFVSFFIIAPSCVGGFKTAFRFIEYFGRVMSLIEKDLYVS